MIQYGLNLEYQLKGFFTLEKSLLNKNLVEMEGLLGYEKGRLQQGADIFIIAPPTKVHEFEIMATSMFPGHKFDGSPLHQTINTENHKQDDLSTFRRQRLIKVVPLQIHTEAMRKYVTDREYQALTSANSKNMKELMDVFRDNPTVLNKLKEDIALSKDIFTRDDINDRLYPSANLGSVEQWKLNVGMRARCVCRMTDYRDDRYSRIL